MPDRKEIAGHLADTIHKEIWETLPQGKENIVQEKAEALALQKGVQLSNLVAWEEEPDNYVLMQYFEWELPDDGQHYQRLKDDARHLKELGVGSVWMPRLISASGGCMFTTSAEPGQPIGPAPRITRMQPSSMSSAGSLMRWW